jgi:hypothetical protein
MPKHRLDLRAVLRITSVDDAQAVKEIDDGILCRVSTLGTEILSQTIGRSDTKRGHAIESITL